MKYEIRFTADGSTTLFSGVHGDTYHSSFGALQESEHIFISKGLLYKDYGKSVRILEVGFGTGLNALLTYRTAIDKDLFIEYTAIEPVILDSETIDRLNYTKMIDNKDLAGVFKALHKVSPGKRMKITDQSSDLGEVNFHFTMINKKIQEARLEKDCYDLVYFDAFGPDAQAEMWTEEVFAGIYYSMVEGGVLVTFSSKGIVKRNLRKAGFTVKRLDGPEGKRHMLRAIKVRSS